MAPESVRRPCVAGVFYPAAEAELRRMVARCLPERLQAAPAIAALVPHAGYAYSGAVTGAVWGRTRVPPTVVLVGFHHRGVGREFAIWPDGSWLTPLGDVSVDRELAAAISAGIPTCRPDRAAFEREHCLEVQIPFLQVLKPDVRVVPISINRSGRQAIRAFAEGLARVIAPGSDRVLVVATTDLTHCGEDYDCRPPSGMTPAAWATEQDRHVLDRIADLDAEGFWRVVHEREVSMCGVDPTAALIEYARARGAVRAEVVRYQTSADGEPRADRAVGYPGVVVRG